MQRGKKKNLLTPTTFSLLHAVDFADRLTYQILPPLKAGMIVLADRYVYTAFARDVARGVHPDWVRSVYSPALRPDLTLYFRVPIDISLERLLSGRAKLKYHEAGMDVGLSADPVESFRMFQSRVLEIYDQLTTEFGMRPIDASRRNPQSTEGRAHDGPGNSSRLRSQSSERKKWRHVTATIRPGTGTACRTSRKSGCPAT